MELWTLWLLLVFNDGSLSVIDAKNFTTERGCMSVASTLDPSYFEDVKRVVGVCKKSIDV